VLSLDTGGVADAGAIVGARENGHFVRPMERFVVEAQTLIERAGAEILSIVVVGGGAAGFELALAAQHRLGRQGYVSLVADPSLLAGYPTRVVARGRNALKRRGVTVVEDECAEIDIGHVVLKGGARLRCDAAWITNGVAAPAWLAASGLTLDARGFVATEATLQSRSHPNVFAAGDVASRTDNPHPKSGVHAVRAGPVLALNLRRALAGSPLLPHEPPRRTLNLLSCGSRDAIACWGAWSAQGPWVWHWKDRIDRRFVGGH
jgi:selenide,water dikinase